MSSYGFSKTVAMGFDEAVEKVTDALQREGFGVLTTIDVQATLKKKLGLDTERYLILGACNPQFAHRALEAEPELGLLLPCNAIVYEDKGGEVHVAVLDPVRALSIVDNPALAPIAAEVRERLQRAIENV
ncbi:MAG: DUF302 domain-containing protein [Firmicutes bacterium]|nr:DUF302 domain-containing protein [Bacillota bacterium]